MTHFPTRSPRSPRDVPPAVAQVLPRHADKAATWLRELTGSADGCTMLRAREYTRVLPDFAKRLFGVGGGAGGKKLADAAAKGRLIGLQLAAEGCLALLSSRVLAWNRDAAEPAAYAPSSRTEAQQMADIFFENTDSGHAMG
eukprot:4536464-Prymnesium_polylepis.1